MNLRNLSLGELRKLQLELEKEIGSREKQQRSKAMGEIKSIASKYGLTVADLVRETVKAPSAGKRPRRSSKKVLYRHPNNADLTWSGGRGRRPQWIKDWEAAGHSLDEVRVARP